MNRSLTSLFAALEAALVVAIGIGIPLVPLTVLWGAQFGFATDWSVFWRASVDVWLLGHGVDVRFTLDPAVAAGLGLAGADAAFPVTIAALGFSLLTMLLGVRAGRRVAETRHRVLGTSVAVGTFAALSLLATLSALYPLARPSLGQGTVLPTLVFSVGLFVGILRTSRAEGDDAGSSIRDWINDWPTAVRATVGHAILGGAAVGAAVIAVSALLLGALFAINYAKVITLYESLHTEVLGGIALTVAQLAFLPNLVIWTASWLVGPGFAIGTGSTVGPLATQLGPIPAIPVLGALPTGDFSFGFLGILVPVVAGFLVAALQRSRLSAAIGDVRPTRWLVVAGIGIGITAGVILGLLAGFSAGAAGPGRLADVGPQAFAVGAWAALEVSLAAIAGLFAAARSPLEAIRAAWVGDSARDSGVTEITPR